MDLDRLKSIVESILFASETPVTITRISEVLGEEKPTEEQITTVLDQLILRYKDPYFGVELRQAQGGYQFTTKAENAEWVRRFLATRPYRLSRSALEALAIIAYRQPITRAEIDNIRGMDCSHLLRTLMERGLVKMIGKAEIPGRPVVYGTTPKFLEVVGLSSLSELPPLSELHELQGDTDEVKDSLEVSLDKVIGDSINTEELVHEEDKGLQEIEQLIDSIRRPDQDIFASPLHEDIAKSNEESLAAYQTLTRQMKSKRMVTNESDLAPMVIDEDRTTKATESPRLIDR